MASAVATIGITHAIQPSDLLVYEIGPVSLRPQAGAFAEFNDNIFYRKTDTESDVIFAITPGLRVLYGEDLPEANHISAEYNLEQDFYLDHSELNASQHRFGLSVFYGTERTKIEGEDRVEFLSSTIGGGYSSVSGQKVDRTVQTDIWAVEYQFGERTGGILRLEHGATDYGRGVRLFDVRTIEGALGFEWLYSDRLRFFGEGYYGHTFVGSNGIAIAAPDNTFGGGFIGARGTFSEKLTGLAKAGYEFYEFDRVTGATGGATSGTAPVVETALTYELTDRTSLTLQYRRRQYASPEFSRTAYASDQVTLGASARLGSLERLRVDVSGRFIYNAYDPSPAFAERNDFLWGGTAALTWLFKPWLSSRLEYNYNQFRSDLPAVIEYDQNRVSLSVHVGY